MGRDQQGKKKWRKKSIKFTKKCGHVNLVSALLHTLIETVIALEQRETTSSLGVSLNNGAVLLRGQDREGWSGLEKARVSLWLRLLCVSPLHVEGRDTERQGVQFRIEDELSLVLQRKASSAVTPPPHHGATLVRM